MMCLHAKSFFFSLQIRYLMKNTSKRWRERFFPQSGSATNIQLKELHRKGSETCFTQVGGYTTVARDSKQGSR